MPLGAHRHVRQAAGESDNVNLCARQGLGTPELGTERAAVRAADGMAAMVGCGSRSRSARCEHAHAWHGSIRTQQCGASLVLLNRDGTSGDRRPVAGSALPWQAQASGLESAGQIEHAAAEACSCGSHHTVCDVTPVSHGVCMWYLCLRTVAAQPVQLGC